MPFLALKPDRASVEALCAAFPDIPDPERLHLTLIHVPDKTVQWPLLNREALEARWQGYGSQLQVAAKELDYFDDGAERLWVLLLGSAAVTNLRLTAEQTLRSSQIAWSSDFSFNPHVTLVRGRHLTIGDVIPSFLTFDRLEWA